MMAACLVLVATRLSAQQEPPKPGPEHEHLKALEGMWDATATSAGGETKGTLGRKMDLNGLWLLEHFQGEAGGMKFEGRGATSYDAAKKKYVNVWIDSMSTSPMVSEGTYDKSSKTLTMKGDMPMPDGKTMKITMVTVTKDANTNVFTMTGAGPDGKDFEMIKITYKRRGK
jgi:hypothetical protein